MVLRTVAAQACWWGGANDSVVNHVKVLLSIISVHLLKSNCISSASTVFSFDYNCAFLSFFSLSNKNLVVLSIRVLSVCILTILKALVPLFVTNRHRL